MKKRFIEKISPENGDATIIEAIIIYPVVFLCVIFLIFAGFTFVQKAHLQSIADRLSDYLANCIMYPGYEDIVDPFYEKSKNTATLDRINTAMKRIDPYRYLFGLFGNSSGNKKLVDNAEKEIIKNYLSNLTFLKPSTAEAKYSDELWNGGVYSENGYVCGIRASTSSVTVFMAQNFVFADFFRMIGINGARMVIYGKSTSDVCDCVETMRLADFAFDAIEQLAEAIGFDTSKITNTIKKLTGNG